MATVDVTVIGAGIFGLSIGYVCARRGARVRVIDRHGIGAGASGGVVGALSPHTPENWNSKKQFQFDSLIAARHFWPEAEALAHRTSGYGAVGRLQPVADEHALGLAKDRAAQSLELWQGQAVWEMVRAEDAGAWAPASPTGWMIRDTLSARLHPRRACACLAGAIRTLGGDVIVGDVVPRGQVVWATGHQGLAALSEDVGRTVGVGVKGQAVLLDYDAGAEVAQVFAEGLHVIPHDDGTVAVGSTSERDFDHPTATDGQVDDLRMRAEAILPCLCNAPVRAVWAGVRPRAKSRAPMLGKWPGRAGHFVANGGFKIGFGMAPGVAEVMADLVLEGRDRVPDAFRVEASL